MSVGPFFDLSPVFAEIVGTGRWWQRRVYRSGRPMKYWHLMRTAWVARCGVQAASTKHYTTETERRWIAGRPDQDCQQCWRLRDEVAA